jgi:uncharacterized membrane protein
MKKQILLLWDYALSVILILTILFLSVKIDQFALGMINPHHTIKFGLGVSLFVGCNILAFLSFTQVFKSTMNKHFKK